MYRNRCPSWVFGLCCLWLITASAGAAEWLPISEKQVEVTHQEGHYLAHLVFEVPVSRALAIDVLTDFDHLAEFLPGLRLSRLRSREGRTFLVEQAGEVRFGPFHFDFESLRQIEMTADGRLLSTTLKSSSGPSSSEMRVSPTASGTRLDYWLDVQPRLWIPSSYGMSMMRHELATQFTAMAREMLRRQHLADERRSSEK